MLQLLNAVSSCSCCSGHCHARLICCHDPTVGDILPSPPLFSPLLFPCMGSCSKYVAPTVQRVYYRTRGKNQISLLLSSHFQMVMIPTPPSPSPAAQKSNAAACLSGVQIGKHNINSRRRRAQSCSSFKRA